MNISFKGQTRENIFFLNISLVMSQTRIVTSFNQKTESADPLEWGKGALFAIHRFAWSKTSRKHCIKWTFLIEVYMSSDLQIHISHSVDAELCPAKGFYCSWYGWWNTVAVLSMKRGVFLISMCCLARWFCGGQIVLYILTSLGLPLVSEELRGMMTQQHPGCWKGLEAFHFEGQSPCR